MIESPIDRDSLGEEVRVVTTERPLERLDGDRPCTRGGGGYSRRERNQHESKSFVIGRFLQLESRITG